MSKPPETDLVKRAIARPTRRSRESGIQEAVAGSRPSGPPLSRGRRTQPSLPRNDYLLFGDETLDPADEEGAVGMQRFGLGRGIGALHGRQIVVPGLSNSIDFDIRRWNVGPGPLAENMRLHVTAQSRHGVS